MFVETEYIAFIKARMACSRRFDGGGSYHDVGKRHVVKYFDDGLAVGGGVPSLGTIVHGDTPELPHTNLLP